MVREPIVAGILYPSSPDLLKKSVQRLLMDAPVLAGTAGAMILPYGHYESVGPLIAAGMKRAAAGNPKRIVLIAAPSGETADGVFVPGVSAFGTPLSELPVDREGVLQLLRAGAVSDDLLHLREHVLEPHLPFLTHLFPGTPILPLLLGIHDTGSLKTVTSIIASLGVAFLREALLIVSSNISSFSELREAGWQSRHLIGAALSHDATRLVHGYRTSLIAGAGPVGVLCNLLTDDSGGTIVARKAHHSYVGGQIFSVEYATIVFDVRR